MKTGTCCPHPVERHAYNGCANCSCGVTWTEHPDRDSDTSVAAALEKAYLATLRFGDVGSIRAMLLRDAERKVQRRLIAALCGGEAAYWDLVRKDIES